MDNILQGLKGLLVVTQGYLSGIVILTLPGSVSVAVSTAGAVSDALGTAGAVTATLATGA